MTELDRVKVMMGVLAASSTDTDEVLDDVVVAINEFKYDKSEAKRSELMTYLIAATINVEYIGKSSEQIMKDMMNKIDDVEGQDPLKGMLRGLSAS